MADVRRISQRFDTTLIVNQREVPLLAFSETESTITQQRHEVLVVANGASNFSIGMGDITTGKRLFLLTDRTISVSLDGTTKYVTVVADTTPLVSGYFLIKGNFTAVNVNNTSGAAATIEVFMEGV